MACGIIYASEKPSNLLCSQVRGPNGKMTTIDDVETSLRHNEPLTLLFSLFYFNSVIKRPPRHGQLHRQRMRMVSSIFTLLWSPEVVGDVILGRADVRLALVGSTIINLHQGFCIGLGVC
jgi:hypothetical protein